MLTVRAPEDTLQCLMLRSISISLEKVTTWNSSIRRKDWIKINLKGKKQFFDML
jgi:hypothetical protein